MPFGDKVAFVSGWIGLTERFTILDPQNSSIGQLSLHTNVDPQIFEAEKLRYFQSYAEALLSNIFMH